MPVVTGPATAASLKPDGFPDLPAVGGVRLATASTGLRRSGRPDLMLAALPANTAVAGVFTRSSCPGAPVEWCRQALAAGGGRVRAIVVNAGISNAFTGAAGRAAARFTAETAAGLLGVDPGEVLVASTGVMGEPLPTGSLGETLPGLVSGLADAAPAGWLEAANAIRTTDTFPKGAWAPVAGTDAVVAGIAKGSGMISPDMATMLAFVFTDLAVPAPVLQEALSRSVGASFNRVTVDSDTSTNDTVLLAATGAAGVEVAGEPTSAGAWNSGVEPYAGDGDLGPWAAFQTALDAVTLDLAHQIVRDGEGASKFVAVTVTGAADDEAASATARSVADSPLVKTAVGAADADWLLIGMAAGKSGQPVDQDRLAVWIGDEQCAEAGASRPGYDEARAARHLQGSEIDIRVDVGVGAGSATVWTCDLTHDFIDLNAQYRQRHRSPDRRQATAEAEPAGGDGGRQTTDTGDQRPAPTAAGSADRGFEPDRRARALIEALPYIQRFRDSVVVVKLGGHAMVDPALTSSFGQDVMLLRSVGLRPVVVHGGGPQIGEHLARLGLASEFRDGLRVTDADTLEVVRMVLVGKVGRDIVAAINVHGAGAVGLSGEDGRLVTAVPRDPALGFVGDVARVDPTVIERLLNESMIPVVSSIGADADGQAYNINADTMAAALAGALRAEKVVYLTDVVGLLADVDDLNSILARVTAAEMEAMVDAGTVSGGMVPKARACADAIRAGTGSAHLLDGRIPHAVLLELFTDAGIGTMVVADGEPAADDEPASGDDTREGDPAGDEAAMTDDDTGGGAP